jgi:hypothetical protein
MQLVTLGPLLEKALSAAAQVPPSVWMIGAGMRFGLVWAGRRSRRRSELPFDRASNSLAISHWPSAAHRSEPALGFGLQCARPPITLAERIALQSIVERPCDFHLPRAAH